MKAEDGELVLLLIHLKVLPSIFSFPEIHLPAATLFRNPSPSHRPFPWIFLSH